MVKLKLKICGYIFGSVPSFNFRTLEGEGIILISMMTFLFFIAGVPIIEQPLPDGGGSLREHMLRQPDSSLPGDKEGYFSSEDTPRSKLPSVVSMFVVEH